MVAYGAPEKEKKSFFYKVLLLLKPGEGQLHGNRYDLHIACAQRSAFDPQIWTHMCLFLATIYAAKNELYDMCTLLSLTTPLSTIYHFNFEKPGVIAKAEGVLAKLMFVYGVLQLFQAPSTMVLLYELILLTLTLVVFIGTNIAKEFYEPWHCLMHVIPAVWAVVLAMFHPPLIII